MESIPEGDKEDDEEDHPVCTLVAAMALSDSSRRRWRKTRGRPTRRTAGWRHRQGGRTGGRSATGRHAPARSPRTSTSSACRRRTARNRGARRWTARSRPPPHAYPEFEVVFQDAAQDNADQVSDVENLLTQGIDLLDHLPQRGRSAQRRRQGSLGQLHPGHRARPEPGRPELLHVHRRRQRRHRPGCR